MHRRMMEPEAGVLPKLSLPVMVSKAASKAKLLGIGKTGPAQSTDQMQASVHRCEDRPLPHPSLPQFQQGPLAGKVSAEAAAA
jgi:hypothetical protein